MTPEELAAQEAAAEALRREEEAEEMRRRGEEREEAERWAAEDAQRGGAGRVTMPTTAMPTRAIEPAATTRAVVAMRIAATLMKGW